MVYKRILGIYAHVVKIADRLGCLGWDVHTGRKNPILTILRTSRNQSLSIHEGVELVLTTLQQPGDFVTKVKQINSQSDVIWMRRFAGLSYLTIRSSVYTILI